MTEVQNRNRSHPVWRFLKSLKLTIALLIILAVASIFGTLLPQQDLYHSLWFRVIIGLLAMNLLVCSLDRFPVTWRLFRLPSRLDRARLFEKLPSERLIVVKGDRNDIAARIKRILKRHYKNIEHKITDKEDIQYGEKTRYAYFGVYLVHLSVLLILLGGIIGSLFGFEGYVNIPEGEAVGHMMLSKKRVPRALPFAIACDKFTINRYENGAPKEYRSDLKFFEGDNLALEGNLRVNHPITFRGITFYQSSYGETPSVHLKMSRQDKKNKPLDYKVRPNYPLPLPEKEGHFQVIDAHANFQGTLGPAVLIAVHPNEGKKRQMWVFQHPENLKKRFPEKMLQSPKFNPSSFDPYTFFLERIDTRYYTVLQVSRDPGVYFVWAGFSMIMIGLFITFFLSYRRIWVRITDDHGNVKVAVAGKTNKNPLGMEKEIKQLLNRIRQQFQDVQET